MSKLRATAVLLGLVLTGCQTINGPDPVAVAEPEVPAPEVALVAPQTLPPAPPPAPPINDNPTQVLGLPAAGLSDLLGDPRFVRRDVARTGVAEVWQYRMDGCVLDVFLYTGNTGLAEVAHFELRSIKGANGPLAESLPASAQRACFARILERKTA